jgi:hypothetical protein
MKNERGGSTRQARIPKAIPLLSDLLINCA